MWRIFWVWVFINAQTIQAVCAVLALFGLFVYAFDTRRIRNATLAQSEASRRPYFTFEANHDLKSGRLTIGAKNVGEGAALSFAIFFGDGTSTQRLQRGFGDSRRRECFATGGTVQRCMHKDAAFRGCLAGVHGPCTKVLLEFVRLRTLGERRADCRPLHL